MTRAAPELTLHHPRKSAPLSRHPFWHLLVLLALHLGYRFAISIVVDIAIPRCIACRTANSVFDVAHSLFRFAFHLLGSTVDLRTGVARPFANLALGSSSRVINRALDLITIHCSTSVGYGLAN